MTQTAIEFARVESDIKEPAEPLAFGALSKEQFDTEIEKGMKDVREGKVYPADVIEMEGI